MGSMATSQLNVRMDAKLRSVGDAVLERVGITPAEVVRALWAKIAKGVEDCEQALSMFADQEDPIVSSRGKECIARIEGWHDELFALVEAPRTFHVAPTDEELEEMLYDDWLAGEERELIA